MQEVAGSNPAESTDVDSMILVTGASGHIGKHLVDTLVKRHEEVRVLVNREGIEARGVEIVRGSILDEEAVKKATRKADVVYHLAALVDYRPYPKDLLYNVNVVGTRNMLEHSEAEKFIYQSSTAVYGKRHRNPADESTPYNPESYYDMTKMMAEKLVLEKNGIVIRCPAIFGPGFEEGYYFMLSQIQKGRMPTVGSGKNKMQWIHIDDLVQALVLAKGKGGNGDVYLVAGPEIKTQEELAAIAARDLGVEKPRKHVLKASAYALAYYKTLSAKLLGKKPSLVPEHVAKITADRTFDTSKAQRELGFQPRVGWEQGIREMVEEFKRTSASR